MTTARKPVWPDVPREDDGRFKPRPAPAPKPEPKR